jgi:hypothetical protein
MMSKLELEAVMPSSAREAISKLESVMLSSERARESQSGSIMSEKREEDDEDMVGVGRYGGGDDLVEAVVR